MILLRDCFPFSKSDHWRANRQAGRRRCDGKQKRWWDKRQTAKFEQAEIQDREEWLFGLEQAFQLCRFHGWDIKQSDLPEGIGVMSK